MPLSAQRRALDIAAVALIILCLLGAAAPDFYRVRDVRAHRDLLRDINDAEQAYLAAHPHTGYACSLDALAGVGLLDPGLVAGQTDSYTFRLNCRGRRLPRRAYALYADPRRGDRPWLCSDDSGTIVTERDSLLKCFDSLRNLHPPAPPSLAIP